MVHGFMVNGVISQILLGFLGIVILVVAAEIAVEKILGLLNYFGFSATFGGLTIFSITTSLPEIFSHAAASYGILTGSLDYKIASATVLGANIGSDVVQQTLILGIVVLLMGGLTFKKDFLKTAYVPMIGTTLMTLILGWDGVLGRIDGLILVGTFLFYMWFLYSRELGEVKQTKQHVHVVRDIFISVSALSVMLFCAHILLMSVENIVRHTGLGGSLIGVVTLGVASAAPELFTALSGVRHKAAGISLGTLIGSNITNPLVAIGGGALASTYLVPHALIYWDLPMETITAALLLLYLVKSKGKLGRYGAIYLIGLYVFYLIIRIAFFAFD